MASRSLQPPRRAEARSARAGVGLTKTWVMLSRIWTGWRTALVIVQPETVISWHRRGFRLWWARKRAPHRATDRVGRRSRVDSHDGAVLQRLQQQSDKVDLRWRARLSRHPQFVAIRTETTSTGRLCRPAQRIAGARRSDHGCRSVRIDGQICFRVGTRSRKRLVLLAIGSYSRNSHSFCRASWSRSRLRNFYAL